MPKKQIIKIIGCKNVDSMRYKASVTDAAAKRSLYRLRCMWNVAHC